MKYLYLAIGLLIHGSLLPAGNISTLPPVARKNPYLTVDVLNDRVRELQQLANNNRAQILAGIRPILAEDYMLHMRDPRFDDTSLSAYYINLLGQMPNSVTYFLLFAEFLQDAIINDAAFLTVAEHARMEQDADNFVTEVNARRNR